MFTDNHSSLQTIVFDYFHHYKLNNFLNWIHNYHINMSK